MRPVWIIDDDQSIRWVIEKALAREGIDYESFSSAQAGLDALGRQGGSREPQVVISDIRMPGVSGLDFMQQLKARMPTTPVIIMTAYSDLDSAVAAFQGGRAGSSRTCRAKSSVTAWRACSDSSRRRGSWPKNVVPQ